jgi:uncharacterized protein (DUF849 family)
MIVQACLNGARLTSFHPALPVTAEAIARDAMAAVRTGAAEVHLHVRDDEGRETLRPEIVDITIGKVRRACPGTLIGISTGEWIEKDDARRRDFIRNWSVLPDYASVNLAEPDCTAVIEYLKKRGVGIEAGIWSSADAARCLELNLGTDAFRLVFEIFQQDKAKALSEFAAIEKHLGEAARLKPVLLHGFDATVWTFVESAFARGYSTRVGLEDGAALPDGRIASSNAALVAAAIELKSKAAKSGG